MKRKDLIKRIESIGSVFVRHGGNHDWYKNPRKEKYQPISRHKEIEEELAKRIILKGFLKTVHLAGKSLTRHKRIQDMRAAD